MAASPGPAHRVGRRLRRLVFRYRRLYPPSRAHASIGLTVSVVTSCRPAGHTVAGSATPKRCTVPNGRSPAASEAANVTRGIQRIGKYQVERRLGSGSFATVWLAYDPDLDARVAI